MATASKAPKKDKVVIQYFHDGLPISSYQNKLSSIAYWYTKGIDAKTPDRVPAKRLLEILTGLGVTDPKTKAFKVTLPNDVVLSATIGSLVKPEPRVKKAAAPKKAAPRKAAAKKAAAKKTTPAKAPTKKAASTPRPPRLTAAERTERNKQVADEGKELKKWKDGGEVGPRPATPAVDALTESLERRPTKGSKKAGQVTAALKKPAAKKATAPKKAAATTKATSGTRPFAGPFPKPSEAKKAAAG